MGIVVEYRDANKEWRWRFVATDGQVLAISGRSYPSKGKLDASIRTLKAEFGTATVTKKRSTRK